MKSTLFSNTVLRAGAGAGKTTRLTQLYYQLSTDFKKQNGRWPKIVLTTFTRKATEEIKERILTLCLENSNEELFWSVSRGANLHISTIHGVLHLFLSKYGKNIGLQPDFGFLSEVEDYPVAMTILHRLVENNVDRLKLIEEFGFKRLLNLLNKTCSYYAYQSDLKPLLWSELISMAQSEADEIYTQFVRLNNLVSFDSTNKQTELWLDFFKNFELKIHNIHKFLENLKNNMEKMSDTGSSEVDLSIMSAPRWNSNKPPFSNTLKETLDELVKKFENLSEDVIFENDFSQKYSYVCQTFHELMMEFSEKMLSNKCRQNKICMSDLETLSWRLIKNNSDCAQNFSEQWDYWMIDEYQDTSPIQMEILSKLIGNRQQFVVGDPQQSIYLFRGAQVQVFTKKEEEIKQKDGNLISSFVNYRSRPQLLHFINNLFSGRFSAMEPSDKMRIYEIQNYPGSNKTPCCELIFCDSEQGQTSEVNAAADKILELITQKINPTDICVLSRSRRPLEELFELTRQLNIPVQLHNSSGFYSRREIRDVLCLLKFLANPHDNLNFLSLLRSPWFKWEDWKILESCEKNITSYWKHYRQKYPEDFVLIKLAELQNLSMSKGYCQALFVFFQQSGILISHLHFDYSGRREANLWKIYFELRQACKQPGFNILTWLRGIDSISGSQDEGGEAVPVLDPERVHLMTIHAAKGLQFKHVLILGVGKEPATSKFLDLANEQEVAPKYSLSLLNEYTQKYSMNLFIQRKRNELVLREREESLRVFYVAVTRAQDALYLISTNTPRKTSWLSQVNINLNLGLHHNQSYSYLVSNYTPVNNKDPLLSKYSTANIEPEFGRMWKPIVQGYGITSQSKLYSKNQFSISQLCELRLDELRELKLENLADFLQKHLNQFAFSSSDFSQIKSNKADLLQLSQAAQRGTQVHLIFEKVFYQFKHKNFSLDDLYSWQGLLAEQDRAATNFLFFDSSNKLDSIFKNLDQFKSEWGFCLRHQQINITGQIDLWGRTPAIEKLETGIKTSSEETWILDYKTGSSVYLEKAMKQLMIYAWCLQKMNLSLGKINLLAVYPYEEKIIEQIIYL